jgi:hypothetical protein
MLDMEDGQDIPVENIVMSSDTQFIISKLKY